MGPVIVKHVLTFKSTIDTLQTTSFSGLYFDVLYKS